MAEVTREGENRVHRLEEQLCRLQEESPKQPKKCQICTTSRNEPGWDCSSEKETCHACHLIGHFLGARRPRQIRGKM